MTITGTDIPEYPRVTTGFHATDGRRRGEGIAKMGDTRPMSKVFGTCTNTFGCMEIRQRRPRGTAKDKVALHLQIDPAVYAKIDTVAGALGISKGRALDLLVASIQVDADGKPDFWDGSLSSDHQKELPLAAIA